MAASPSREEQRRRLAGIAGVGAVVSAALTPVLERYAFKKADSFVAFLGYDPRPQDSGQKRGRRRPTKRGPSELRRLLYIAAMAAVRTKTWKPLYEHYRPYRLVHVYLRDYLRCTAITQNSLTETIGSQGGL